MQSPEFSSVMRRCTGRVRKMYVSYVVVPDNITQHLFEVYCALALKTPYNEFKTS